MKKQKKLFMVITSSMAMLLIGIILGGSLVHIYYNSKTKTQVTQKNNYKNTGNTLDEAQAYLKFKAIKETFMPTGIPAVYGKELNISFDEVQDAINKVKLYGPTYGQPEEKIALADFTPTELKRYKNIGAQIACEYCCGVKTLTREDGAAACGCAHSIMMRGLSAYLLTNHSEMSDKEILNELQLWKRAYFPKQTLSAELARLAQAGEPGIEQILREFPDFLPKMVGGC